ncbi:zona pellucida sperm-binding protein 2 [Pyxicephalus adspersus]|uniref:zona pellucida sperm-binding protein 2 n=1 Tax=Pyxicephalus adspersus TaxID=30357 RepID=UPI003B5C71F5
MVLLVVVVCLSTSSIVDPSGVKVEACDLHPNEANVTIPETCIGYEADGRVAYVSVVKQSKKNLVYKITCHDYQADYPYDGPIIECGQYYMLVKISRTLTDFSDEAVPEPPIWTWMVVIHDEKIGNQTKVNVAMAKTLGYTLTSDPNNYMVQINYNALGINTLPENKQFYYGWIELVLEKLNPKVTFDLKVRCAQGPFPCDGTQMIISIPQMAGKLQFIEFDNVAIPIPSSVSALQRHGLTVDTRSGTQISISKEKLTVLPNNDPVMHYLPSLTLIFALGDVSLAMRLEQAMRLSGQCKYIPTQSKLAFVKLFYLCFFLFFFLLLFSFP